MSSRHAPPMFVDLDNRVQTLRRLVLGQDPNEDGQRREAFIQNLVHDHPTLIPMSEIEPAFSPLISVCKELPTPAGYVDNLWITPWGGLVLGEAKLVRNPQARREVVAQALDYARALTDWSFEDLELAVRRATKQPDLSLWKLVEDVSDLDEAQFVDAVERRLRAGRLLLLIIGDGIQEGVEALTAHLQLHAGLHVGLALLDLSLWRDVNGGLIVVPRIPMRTVLIERGIVRVDVVGARIEAIPAETTAVTRTAAMPAKTSTQSESEFWDHMQTKRPEDVQPLRSFLIGLTDIGIVPEFRKSVVLRFVPTADVAGSAGFIEPTGKVWFNDVTAAAVRLGRPEFAERYLAAVASIVGGQVRRYEKSAPAVLDGQGRSIDAKLLLKQAVQWKEAIANLVTELALPA
jgi:hypothetical protein